MSGIVGTSYSKSKVVGRSKDTAIAWVNFYGVGTPVIRDDFNVSSIGDLSEGYYSINFEKAMSNTNYCAVGSASFSANSHSYVSNLGLYELTTSLIKIRTTYNGQADGSSHDSYWTTLTVFA